MLLELLEHPGCSGLSAQSSEVRLVMDGEHPLEAHRGDFPEDLVSPDGRHVASLDDDGGHEHTFALRDAISPPPSPPPPWRDAPSTPRTFVPPLSSDGGAGGTGRRPLVSRCERDFDAGVGCPPRVF